MDIHLASPPQDAGISPALLVYAEGMNSPHGGGRGSARGGRNLTGLSKTGTTATFTYNMDGIRTSKTVNGTTTTYTLVDGRVTHETNGTNSIYYRYDSNEKLISMNLNGTEYYYFRNAQDDIMGLVDTAGSVVVEYTYDAWGNILSTTGSLASTVGVANPYRYRGYRFDGESGLYYLKSRYYNPVWERFCNSDSISEENTRLLSNNSFGYCLNNPVNLNDPNGFSPPFTLPNGWRGRIDEANTSTQTQRHVHVYKGNEKYAQNKDGSPHDGSMGGPPNSIKDALKESKGWDWDAKIKKHNSRIARERLRSRLRYHDVYYNPPPLQLPGLPGVTIW